ncbi:MAG: cystathionine beta-synthase [Alphaproteobacteria bacterium]|nr:cystathionine beta-synthase [Alphaproteobacteria bacterium]
MSAAANVLDLIGNTPMVEVKNIDTGPCRLFLKLESQNPGGSIKDRIGLSMILAAEKNGTLKTGGTVIEATAGNTGLGLALVARQKGYKMIVVVPDKMSQEKILHLKALGADVRMTRSDVGKGHPEYYQDMAERIHAETPNSIWINQFANPANPIAHETTTGPEILEQMDGDIDAMVVGVGSGGTLSGLGRFFKANSPKTKMILADPKGSVLADMVETGTMGELGSWLVEGIGEDFVPPNCDLSLVAEAVRVSDEEAFATTRELLEKEGLLGGSSTGTLVAAALRYCRAQTEPKRVCTFVCDSGNKYLSKAFNPFWLTDAGLVERERFGDLRDFVSRRLDKGEIVSVGPKDTLATAFTRMRLHDVSQLPVLEDDRVVGILDEGDVLLSVHSDSTHFDSTVDTAMTAKLITLPYDAALEDLIDIFKDDRVAIVMDADEKFFGLVTKSDAINTLKRLSKAA